MDKDDIIRKLTSRKFWAAVCSFVGLIIVAVGHSESEAAQVTAIIMAGASVLAYILGEGLIDAAREGADVFVEEAEEGEE
jgi:hypothetical protein